MARIAMPVGEDFEDSEFQLPYDQLTGHGHQVVIFGSQKATTIKGKRGEAEATVTHTADELEPADFDALVIPGGYSPDHLRNDALVVDFVRCFAETEKPLAAICHGPQLLIEADVVRGKTVTSWPSVRKDLENAGARWLDQEVVVDGNLITSRKPDDLPAFCKEILWHLEPSEAPAELEGNAQPSASSRD